MRLLWWAAVLVLVTAASQPAEAFKYDFLHGVASGDPLSDSIVLWTRITHRFEPETTQVRWVVLDSEDVEVASAVELATASSDFTIKVIVGDLLPATEYKYYFEAVDGDGGSRSPTGNFRTLPDPSSHVDRARFAVFSCSNWGWGYWNAYDAATASDIDFWIHLGDYYYEYGPDTYPSRAQAVRPRGLEPDHEAVSLEDYRLRHATYRLDPDLQRLSASAALVAIWDDHEVADNQYSTGAHNHDPETEGSFFERRTSAIRAYHEWLPTRSGKIGDEDYVGERYFRELKIGNLASMFVLETRMLNRTDPDEIGDLMGQTASMLAAAAVEDVRNLPEEVEKSLFERRDFLEGYRRRENKTLLSWEELRWIERQTRRSAESGVTWQLFAQQIVMADIAFADLDRAADLVDASRAAGWREQIDNATCSNGARAVSFSPAPFMKENLMKEVDLSARDCLSMRAGWLHGKLKIPYNLDMWAGYLAERERFYEATARASRNMVVYSGDSHNSWASNLRDKDGNIIAAEVAGTSVSSAGIETFVPFLSADLMSAGFLAANPDLLYANTEKRGFFVVDLTHETHRATYVSVDQVETRDYKAFCEARLEYDSVGVGQRREKGMRLLSGEHCDFGGPREGPADRKEAGVGSQYWVAAPFVITSAILIMLVPGLVLWKRRSARRRERYIAMMEMSLEEQQEL